MIDFLNVSYNCNQQNDFVADQEVAAVLGDHSKIWGLYLRLLLYLLIVLRDKISRTRLFICIWTRVFIVLKKDMCE